MKLYYARNSHVVVYERDCISGIFSFNLNIMNQKISPKFQKIAEKFDLKCNNVASFIVNRFKYLASTNFSASGYQREIWD